LTADSKLCAWFRGLFYFKGIFGSKTMFLGHFIGLWFYWRTKQTTV